MNDPESMVKALEHLGRTVGGWLPPEGQFCVLIWPEGLDDDVAPLATASADTPELLKRLKCFVERIEASGVRVFKRDPKKKSEDN